ncbi:hypothetical protein QZN11_16945, partial [Streptomyces gramineus]
GACPPVGRVKRYTDAGHSATGNDRSRHPPGNRRTTRRARPPRPRPGPDRGFGGACPPVGPAKRYTDAGHSAPAGDGRSPSETAGPGGPCGQAVASAESAARARSSEAAAAARGGDLGALLGLPAPDVVRHADPATLPPGVPAELRGARAVAEGTVLLRERPRSAVPALIDNRPGVPVAPLGRLRYVLRVTVADGRVAAYEVIADPERLRGLDPAAPRTPPAPA